MIAFDWRDHIENAITCYIELLEKNYNADYSLNIKEWNIVTKWLEEYYCEIKELFIKERDF